MEMKIINESLPYDMKVKMMEIQLENAIFREIYRVGEDGNLRI